MGKTHVELPSQLEKLIERRLEPLVRDALTKLDPKQLGLDRDEIESSIRERLEALAPEKFDEYVRQAWEGLDGDKAEAVVQEAMARLDPHRFEQQMRRSLGGRRARRMRRRIQSTLGDLGQSAQRSIRDIDLSDLNVSEIEELVRKRVDSLLHQRLQSIDLDEIESALRKRARGWDISQWTSGLEDTVEETVKDARKGAKGARRAARRGTRRGRELASRTGMVEPPRKVHPVASVLGGATKLAVASAAGWVAYSYFVIDHRLPLPKAVPAEQSTLDFRPSGTLNLYRDRSQSGRPLVLIHSVNAAASAYEMRPLFQHYRNERPVYALDLPGFGFSARPRMNYTPELYVQAVLALLDEVDEGPADVVALSLGSEFAAEAARRRPDLVNSLTLISPTGMGKQHMTRNLGGAGDLGQSLLRFPLWARPFYDLLTTRRSINYFLKQSFVDDITPGLVDYCYATAHQPGAEHAPLAFVSGRLFTPNASTTIYQRVTTPTLVLYDRDPYVTFDTLSDILAHNGAWHATRIVPSCGLPHFERLEETAQAIDRFWNGLEQGEES